MVTVSGVYGMLDESAHSLDLSTFRLEGKWCTCSARHPVPVGEVHFHRSLSVGHLLHIMIEPPEPPGDLFLCDSRIKPGKSCEDHKLLLPVRRQCRPFIGGQYRRARRKDGKEHLPQLLEQDPAKNGFHLSLTSFWAVGDCC